MLLMNGSIALSGGGGGIHSGNNSEIRNCLIYENESNNRGGGAYISYGDVMYNCTIVNNTSGWSGGGLSSYQGADAYNVIVYYNSIDGDTSHAFSNYRSEQGGQLFNSCVTPLTYVEGSNNFSLEPLFVDRAHNNYELSSQSQCIDTGVNASWMVSATDLAGTLRIVNTTVDRGCYESIGDSLSAWDAGYTDLGGSWRRLAWFGDYVPTGSGWFWHNRHGYFFPAPSCTSASIYMYTMDMGWLFTRQNQYPYLYRFSDQCWLWYLPDSSNPRWFNNLTLGVWESRP